MNNKGFTLIELLAVIAILALITSIATPNILNMINNSKNEQYVSYTTIMLSKAKYYYNLKDKYEDLFTNEDNCMIIPLKNLDIDPKDPEGNNYDVEKSKVKICIENSNIEYYLKLFGSKKGIFDKNISDQYINANDITTNSVVSP